jgi:hypothetical protein
MASSFALPPSTQVLIFSDFNLIDPKPHTIAESLKFKVDEVHFQRVTSLSTLKAFRDSKAILLPGLKYLIVACFSPILVDCLDEILEREEDVGN